MAGLGLHQASLLDGEIDMFNKYNYAYQILFIITICLSKISLLLFIIRLTPNNTTIRVGRIAMGVITLWGIATVFALAFQCSLPQPWNIISGVCHNQDALYYSAGIIDIITDIGVIALPLVMLWTIQIPRAKRITVMTVFIVRISYVSWILHLKGLWLTRLRSVCLAEIARLIYLTRYLRSSDKTWDSVDLSIWTQ